MALDSLNIMRYLAYVDKQTTFDANVKGGSSLVIFLDTHVFAHGCDTKYKRPTN